ncbi:MAG TPA: hypothetical protein PKL28_09930 [Rhodocyclaceae bacterium]|jgi:hypothetical protein|nr:hypothetical protein [Rhodocyclaceae bacterium]HNE44260.1 hypothetical protein [Rhodocyclaceae bacterium]HNL21307.1 hypothetical protein [Rhodocyclaceae bacterium]HNM81367.1 hypothetical protein [Rhodocyclaceae bacterium]
MDPIKPLDGLAEMIRKRLVSEGAGRSEEHAPPRSREARPGEVSGRPTTAALRSRIADALQAVDPDDPERNRKAIKAFVENVLAWQFGSDVLNDPALAGLVDDVQQTLEREPNVTALLEALRREGKP